MKHLGAALLLSILLACGQAPAPEAAQAPEAAPPPAPRDQSYRVPKAGQVSTSNAADHVLGKDFQPPGNVAEYSNGDKTYTLFLISTTGDEATMLAYDIKEKLADAKFIADFGGFAGTLDGEPWFIFPKQHAVAGIVGLPQDEAYDLGRLFASQLE